MLPNPCNYTSHFANMASNTSALMFPHPKLTPIIGKPTNTALKQLTKEIYANKLAIPSTRGGGGHGHLGLIMPLAEYKLLTGGVFQLLSHPGPVPVHAIGANAATQQETMHAYDATLKELALATNAREEMKCQLLDAVECLYLAALDDDTFGFADVAISAMLVHLCTMYGPITHGELKANCASTATMWTPDNPIETLWECVQEVQHIALAGSDLLTKEVLCNLTLLMCEATGVFTMACNMWCVKLAANQMLIKFRQHFTNENKECL